MKKPGRFLSILAGLCGVVLLTRRKNRSVHRFAVSDANLILPALSPLIALAGGAGALASLLSGEVLPALAGMLGAAAALRYTGRVTQPHAGFVQAFGPEWEQRIPASQRARMLRARWTPIQRDPPLARWERNVVIGAHAENGSPLLADLWLPPEGVEPTGLGVIYLHGSGWRYLDKDVGTRRFFAHLASQGHIILDVAYTLAPRSDMQGMLNDVRRAIAWMKVSGPSYGVRPDRVALIGGSAGGHLALLAAYTPCHPDLKTPDVTVETSVRAVVSYYGVADLTAAHNRANRTRGDTMMGRTPISRWILNLVETFLKRRGWLAPEGEIVPVQCMISSVMGGAPDEKPDAYRLYSPISHVGPDCVPTLIIQGEDDQLVYGPEQGEALYRALRAVGVPAIYVRFPDTEHGFDLFFPKWNPAYQSATYDVERFLALML